MSPTKSDIRAEALRLRHRLTGGIEQAEQACDQFFTALSPAPGQVIAAYWPKGNELDVRVILDESLKRGFTCALPVVPPEGRVLDFARWDETVPLEKGAYGILQPVLVTPVTPNIVIVPLLAFDRKGNRIGYGGGYYDATLHALRNKNPSVTAVGLAYGEQACLYNLPAEPHDERLDWVITPQRAFCYREQA